MKPESRALLESFDQHIMPVLNPLGFVPIRVPEERRAVGWVIAMARCELAGGDVLEVSLASGSTTPRFHLSRLGASCQGVSAAEIPSNQHDPSSRHPPSLAVALAEFETAGDAQRGGDATAARRRVAIEFLALTLASATETWLALAPELKVRIESACTTPLWRSAASRAKSLWDARHERNDYEERPVEVEFVRVTERAAVVRTEERSFTFLFDTSRIDTNQQAWVSGWWRSVGGTLVPSILIVGATRLRFSRSGLLADP